MKIVNMILVGLLCVLCGLRAGQEVLRIVREPVRVFHPEISACSPQPSEMEALLVWNYRHLGAVCKK